MSSPFDSPYLPDLGQDPGHSSRGELSALTTRLDTLSLVLEELDRLASPQAEAGVRERILSDEQMRNGVKDAIARVVELATEVNARVIGLIHAPYPTGPRDSFHQLAGAGLLEHDLAQQLARSVGLRDVLLYDTDTSNSANVAAALFATIACYQAYLRVMREWIGRRVSTSEPG